MIPENITKKLQMPTLTEMIELEGDTNEVKIRWYSCFLNATDYICNKIVEGVATWDDYAEEKKYRQIAREEINKLR